jgi:hypothetical protein
VHLSKPVKEIAITKIMLVMKSVDFPYITNWQYFIVHAPGFANLNQIFLNTMKIV